MPAHLFAVDFLCNGERHTAISVIGSGVDTIQAIQYTNNGEYEGYGAYLDGYGWEDGYRVVDFGTNSQIVSVEFYDWLTSNATRID